MQSASSNNSTAFAVYPLVIFARVLDSRLRFLIDSQRKCDAFQMTFFSGLYILLWNDDEMKMRCDIESARNECE